VGDSWSQAYGVRDEDSFGWLLQAKFPSLRVENFGTGGYGVLQSWMMLKRYFEQKNNGRTKLVILAFTPYMNDRNMPSVERVSSLRTSGNNVFFPPFVERHTKGKYEVTAPYTSFPWPLEQHLAVLNLLHEAVLKASLWQRQVDTFSSEVSLYYIARMRALAKKHKASFLFVWLLKGSIYDEFQTELHRDKIPSIDCEHPKGYPAELQVGGKGHPNPEYHRYVADCIARYIAENPLS
jgi:hypothetical protein